MKKTTAIYVSVSHRDQTHASQMPDLERWAEAHDGSVQWFSDKFSDKTMNRLGVDKLMETFRSCRFHACFIAWRSEPQVY